MGNDNNILKKTSDQDKQINKSTENHLEHLQEIVVSFFAATVPTVLTYLYPHLALILVPIGSSIGTILGSIVFKLFSNKYHYDINIRWRRYFWFVAFSFSNTFFLYSTIISLNDMGMIFVCLIGFTAGSIYIWFIYIQWRLGLITRLFTVIVCLLPLGYVVINSIPPEKIFAEIFLLNYGLTYFTIFFMTPLIKWGLKVRETINEEAFYNSECHFQIVFTFFIITFVNAVVISMIILSEYSDIPEILAFFIFAPAVTAMILKIYFKINPRSLDI